MAATGRGVSFGATPATLAEGDTEAKGAEQRNVKVRRLTSRHRTFSDWTRNAANGVFRVKENDGLCVSVCARMCVRVLTCMAAPLGHTVNLCSH